MMQTFTQNDLLRHLYIEESPMEGAALEDYISKSEDASHNFEDYCQIKSALNQISLEPSKDSIQMIFSYSQLSRFI